MKIRLIHVSILSLSFFYGFVGASTQSPAELDKTRGERPKPPPSPSPSQATFADDSTDVTDLSDRSLSPPHQRRLVLPADLSPVPENAGRTSRGSSGDDDDGRGDPPAVGGGAGAGAGAALGFSHSDASREMAAKQADEGQIRHWADSEFGAFHIIVSTAVLEAVKSAAASRDLASYFVQLKEKIRDDASVCALVDLAEFSFSWDTKKLREPKMFGAALEGIGLSSLQYLCKCARGGTVTVRSLIIGITWLYAELVAKVAEGAEDGEECHFGHSFIYQNRFALPLAAAVAAVSQYFQSLLPLSPEAFWADFYNLTVRSPARRDTSDPAKHDSTLWVYEVHDGVHPMIFKAWKDNDFAATQSHFEVARALCSRQLTFTARIAEYIEGVNYLYDRMTGVPPSEEVLCYEHVAVVASDLGDRKFSDVMMPAPNGEFM